MPVPLYNTILILAPLALLVMMAVVFMRRARNKQLSLSYQVRIDQLQKRLNAQEDLLHLVTNSDPELIIIFDKDNRFWFVNASAAREAGISTNDFATASSCQGYGS